MTMVKRDSNNIWSLVREDRDIDDLIFAGAVSYTHLDVYKRQLSAPLRSPARSTCGA